MYQTNPDELLTVPQRRLFASPCSPSGLDSVSLRQRVLEVIVEALEALHGRNSAARLTGDVAATALENILKAGLRAPDHAQLRPWRILVVTGAARHSLGALFALAGEPTAAPDKLARLRSKPLRAPVVIIVAASPTEHPKVPRIEQLLSAAAVVQNMSLAAHAQGLGAIWRTGGMAYDPTVAKGLGLEEGEQIVGFLYIGEIDGRTKNLPQVAVADYVEYWQG